MIKGKTINTTTGKWLLTGASVLVLTACVPDDDVRVGDADSKADKAQVTMYSQAFQNYSNQSLDAIVNSSLWQAQVLPEGEIDLSLADFGALDMGDAEAYIQSAHCKIGGESYHLTWFDKADNDGHVFLKGLGKGQSGQTTLAVKNRIPEENFAILKSGVIEKPSGTTLALSGACSTLNIPENSAIAAVMIPEPVQISMTQEKLITRMKSCGAGEEGSIMQTINALYSDTGVIIAGGHSFASESDVMSSAILSDSDWNEVSNTCLVPQESISRVASSTNVDALNMAALSGLSGAISNALKDNLSNIECKDVTKETEEENEAQDNKEFDTCNEQVDLDTLTDMSVTEKTLLRQEEEVVLTGCPAQTDTNKKEKIVVDLVNNQDDFMRISQYLDGKTGVFKPKDLTGDVTIAKITRFYEVISDYGRGNNSSHEGGGRKSATSDGDCTSGVCTKEEEHVSYEGRDISCQRDQSLTFACNDIFNADGSIEGDLKKDQAQIYTGVGRITGFEDPEKLTPYDIVNGHWKETQNAQCKWEKDLRFVCPTGYRKEKDGLAVLQTKNTGLSGIDSQIITKKNIACYRINGGRRAVVRGDKGSGWGADSCYSRWNRNKKTLDATITVISTLKYFDYTKILQKTKRQRKKYPVNFSKGYNSDYARDCRDTIVDKLKDLGFNNARGVQDGKKYKCFMGVCQETKGIIRFSGTNVSGSIGFHRWSCFTGDTLVAMADGSFKPIAQVREGDMTVAGRVSKTYVRDFDPSTQHTSASQVIYRGGLFDYNGVKVTGNHVVYEDGQWIEVADSKLSRHLPDYDTRIVYNMDVDHAIVPVINDQEDMMYFADNLNNIGGASQRGFYSLNVKSA